MERKSVSGSVWLTEADFSVSKAELDRLVSRRELFRCDTFYCTPYLATCENEIAKNVMRLMLTPHKVYSDKVLDSLINDGEILFNQKLHFQQRNAVKMACNNMFSILTGGPGTGKTTVMKMMVYVMRRLMDNPQICITAPTGKASHRIMENTGECAFTLHKKLAISKKKKDPDFFDGDILFVDEASMIDTELASKLFIALRTGKRLIFAGDIDQLPSVGPGCVLRDLIRSKVVPVTMLTHTFRQDSESGLMTNIINIREGNLNLVNADDFVLKFVDGRTNFQIEQEVLSLYLDEVKKYGKDGVVVLIPYRRTKICSNRISEVIQQVINPGNGYVYESQQNGTISFKKGDIVMQLENRDECSNGDVGEIIEVSKYGDLVVQYEDGIVQYGEDELEQLSLAYSMTIHKAQGSEYDSVILVILDQHANMLERNLIYTGVTRAKKTCNIVCQSNALKKSIQTVSAMERKTYLTEKLIYVRENYKLQYAV